MKGDAELHIPADLYSWDVENDSLQAVVTLQCCGVCIPAHNLNKELQTAFVCMRTLERVKMFPCAARLPVSPPV